MNNSESEEDGDMPGVEDELDELAISETEEDGNDDNELEPASGAGLAGLTQMERATTARESMLKWRNVKLKMRTKFENKRAREIEMNRT